MCEDDHDARAGAAPALELRRRALFAGMLSGGLALALSPAGPVAAARAAELLPLDSPTSPNGWPVSATAATIGVRTAKVVGTNVSLSVRQDIAGQMLLHVARRFHQLVEPLEVGCWGYAYRANVNSTSSWSNHASATAIDLNAPRHPNGAAGTFTPQQVTAIRRILEECRGTVRWGGDYSRTKDEMHFEIDVPPGHINLYLPGTTPPPSEDDPMRNLIIAKKSGASDIWVGDGLVRRQIADMTELRNVQYLIGLRGGDAAIRTIDDMRALGVAVSAPVSDSAQ